MAWPRSAGTGSLVTLYDPLSIILPVSAREIVRSYLFIWDTPLRARADVAWVQAAAVRYTSVVTVHCTWRGTALGNVAITGKRLLVQDNGAMFFPEDIKKQ